MSELSDCIRAAWSARDALHGRADTDAYRVFHGYAEGHAGLEIDRYGPWILLTSKGPELAVLEEAARVVADLGEVDGVIARCRGHTPQALVGTLPTRPGEAREAGLRYSIEAWLPGNPGLYLDARPARTWLRDNSEGRRVLNLFSFAGSLGVAAMAGGALSVTHVDSQKRALKRCQENHQINEQAIDHRDLLRLDVPRYLSSSAAEQRGYGGVILDPPPIKGGSRRDPQALGTVGLSGAAARLLQPGGWLLCFFHHDPRSWSQLEAEVIAASGGRLEATWRSRSGRDFPEEDERRALRLSAFTAKV